MDDGLEVVSLLDGQKKGRKDEEDQSRKWERTKEIKADSGNMRPDEKAFLCRCDAPT